MTLNRFTRFKEGIRLSLIVGSSLSIALAGNLAQSRNQEPSDALISPEIVKEVTVKAINETPSEKSKPETKLAKFATVQVQTFQEMLDGLTERAEIIAETNNINDTDRARLQKALKEFDEDLMIAREALARLKAAQANNNSQSNPQEDAFLEEDLKSSLFIVQESASLAQGEVISLDQFQGFKVSRTGQ